MENLQRRIGNTEIFMIVFGVIIGERLISLPRVAVDAAGYGAIVSIAAGGLVATGMAYLFARLSSNFPDKMFLEFSEKILGKLLNKGLTIIFLIYFAIFGAIFARRIGEFLKIQLLNNTPLEVIIISFILIAAYCAIGGVPIYGRVSGSLMVFSILIIVFLFAIATPFVYIEEVRPAFHYEGLKKINLSQLGIPAYNGLEIILFLLPFVRKGADIKKVSFYALLASMLFFVMNVGFTMAIIGERQLQHQYYPVFSVAKEVAFPGLRDTSTDIFFASFWAMLVYIVMVGYSYLSSVCAAKLFEFQSSSVFVVLFIPLLYAISLIPQNLGEMDSWLRFLEKVWLFGIVGSIFVVYLVGIARKKVKA